MLPLSVQDTELDVRVRDQPCSSCISLLLSVWLDRDRAKECGSSWLPGRKRCPYVIHCNSRHAVAALVSDFPSSRRGHVSLIVILHVFPGCLLPHHHLPIMPHHFTCRLPIILLVILLVAFLSHLNLSDHIINDYVYLQALSDVFLILAFFFCLCLLLCWSFFFPLNLEDI